MTWSYAGQCGTRSAALRQGEVVIEDRGCLDGKSITELKSVRKVDVIVGQAKLIGSLFGMAA